MLNFFSVKNILIFFFEKSKTHISKQQFFSFFPTPTLAHPKRLSPKPTWAKVGLAKNLFVCFWFQGVGAAVFAAVLECLSLSSFSFLSGQDRPRRVVGGGGRRVVLEMEERRREGALFVCKEEEEVCVCVWCREGVFVERECCLWLCVFMGRRFVVCVCVGVCVCLWENVCSWEERGVFMGGVCMELDGGYRGWCVFIGKECLPVSMGGGGGVFVGRRSVCLKEERFGVGLWEVLVDGGRV